MSSPWPTRGLLRHDKKNGEELGQELSFQMSFGLFYTLKGFSDYFSYKVKFCLMLVRFCNITPALEGD